jgi:HK97 family phage major capsid protein
MNLKEKLQKALLDARAICEQAEKENRDFTPEERQQVAGYMDEAKTLKAQIKDAEGDAALRAAVADFAAELAAQPDPVQAAIIKGTLGERFVNAPEFQAWIKSVAPEGRIPERSALMSPPVMFKNLWGSGRKDLITGESDTSAGAFVQTDYTGIYEPLGRYPLNVLGLVSRRTTTSDLVEFVRQTVKVQEAAVVAEATDTDYTGATGQESGEKPEGAVAFEKVTSAVKTLAVWVPATRRALSDAAQIRGIIDQELRDDLDEEFEDQILNGDGTGENFTGIMNTANVLTQAFDTDILTTIRKARTNLAVNGRSRPTAIVLHPNDMETIDLLEDDQGRFYFGGPIDGGVQRIWRVPAVESESIDEGTALMGDFRKAVVWDREQANIQVSNSHEDFFIRNMVAILAEMRAAFGVIRPTAFCVIDLESGS